MNIGIVTAKFNREITSVMERHALQRAKELKINVVKASKVPGSFDMPIVVKKLLERKDIDAVVTLGAIIKGDTKHDEAIGYAVTKKLADLSIEYGKPVTLGIIGPGATRRQAEERAKDYAERALDATVELCEELNGL